MKKLERARALLSNTNGNLSYEFVLEAALDEFLKDHDPEERNKRREARKQTTESRAKSGERAVKKSVIPSGGRNPQRGWRAGRRSIVRLRPSEWRTSRRPFVPTQGRRLALHPRRCGPGAARRIPAATRDAVFARDKGRCTYVGSNGERCAATHHLQIDHVMPYARGGTNTLGNLRLLCERHNKKEAERVFGPNVTGKFRANV